MSIKEELLEIIKGSEQIISDELAIRFILLVGSQTTTMTGPMSDVDIAIYVNPDRYSNDNPNLQIKLGALLGDGLKRDDIDIIILNDAPPAMRFNVVKNGLILYVKDEGEYEDYVVRTLSDYYDYSYFLNRQFEYAKASLSGESK